MGKLIFQQLFESESSTFTYLLADAESLEGVIIDPVWKTVERDLKLIKELEISLSYVLETHIHADHVTGATRIADQTGARIALSASAGAQGTFLPLADGDVLTFGGQNLKVIATPGHTSSCVCYYMEGRVFTGDTLMIRGNGRTDFQDGCPKRLYQNVVSRLFTLPEETVVYPAHDYRGFTSSSIEMEKKYNPRLNLSTTEDAFVQTMADLKLPPPKKINMALPANRVLGKR